MALTAPIPPTGVPTGMPDIGGVASMLGQGTPAGDAQNEQFLQKLRPALSIMSQVEKQLAQLDQIVTQNPEITDVVRTFLQAKMDRFKARGGKSHKAEGPPPPLMAPGGTATPQPVASGPGAVPPPPVRPFGGA